jgi:acyl transferase domain-containing protein
MPGADAQEALIRQTYRLAGIDEDDFGQTGFFEMHGTGTVVGDKLETTAAARVFGG